MFFFTTDPHEVNTLGVQVTPKGLTLSGFFPYYFQVPKTDKSDPRRLRKEMPRMLKNIGPEDRIVVVGTTNAPWNCDVKVRVVVSLSCSRKEVLFLCPRWISIPVPVWISVLCSQVYRFLFGYRFYVLKYTGFCFLIDGKWIKQNIIVSSVISV